MIKARALNFKMAASRFVNVCAEVVNVIKGNSTAKSTKDAIEFGGTLPKKIDVFYQPKFSLVLIEVITFIYRIYYRIREHLSNCTNILIHFRLSKHCKTVPSTSP